MYDLFVTLVTFAAVGATFLVRRIELNKRVWIGLAFLTSAWCAASVGFGLAAAGFESPLFKSFWAGGSGALGVLAVIFLAPSLHDWLGTVGRRAHR